MALFRDDAGKTEKATPQRLDEAQRKGQVPLSREMIMGGTLLAVALALQFGGGWLLDVLRAAMGRGLRVDTAIARLNDGETGGFIAEIQAVVVLIAPPILGLMALVVVAAAVFGYGQIGVKLATKAFGLKFERLNPVQGLQRIFSTAALARTGLSFLKLAALGAVPAVILWRERATFTMLYDAPDLAVAASVVLAIILRVVLWIAAIVLLIAAVDVLWQRYDHQKKLMMSKQEVDDERKRSEGDPMIKNRLRAAARKLARQRMMDAVPVADVVITNPTHFAVALAYDRQRHPAPRVVAKGMDHLAQKIRELARHSGVPVMQDPPLARALYRACDVGTEIPERFYQAVAVVLSHVYRLRGMTA